MTEILEEQSQRLTNSLAKNSNGNDAGSAENETKIIQSTLEAFQSVRRESTRICEPLMVEDYGLQAMPEVSPPKWHLAHTSWFFETFILKPFCSDYQVFHPQFETLFNSYYNGIGEQYPRPQRGLLSRPSLHEVFHYRDHIDLAMSELLQQLEHDEYQANRRDILTRVTLGINHEQQHQELILTDLKYSFSHNPLFPSFIQPPVFEHLQSREINWYEFASTDTEIGYTGNNFCFDNELPAHKFSLRPYKLADRLVTNAEYKAFVEDGGYQQAQLWMSDGWAWVKQNAIKQPLYWHHINGEWHEYTLYGLIPLNGDLPACHLNFYEADAYARWCDKRLPTEFEWEHAAKLSGTASSDQSRHNPELSYRKPYLHPGSDTEYNSTDDGSVGIKQLFDCVWQWTSSAYSQYSGYQPAAGAIGEYNGKFMRNQVVLKGSSCVTPAGHARESYRNFFYPVDRWQFSGIRLADDV